MSLPRELSCPLCDGTDYRQVAATPALSVYICNSCGLSRTVPQQIAASAEIYASDYHLQHSYLASSLNEQVARMRLDMLRHLKPAARTFLDVGCATGYAVQLAREYGWESYSVDVSAFATDYARRERGLANIYTGSLVEARLPSRHFDIIYCYHVLEHMPDPLDNLREMARLLSPDGVLFISVPNLRSVKHWLKGDGWYTPYHLYNYSADTLCRMLGRAELRILKLWTDSPGFVPLRPRRRNPDGVPGEASAGAKKKTLKAARFIKSGLIRVYAATANFIADHLGRGDNLNVLAQGFR